MNQERDFSWLADVRVDLQATDLVEPPDWVRQSARQLFRRRRAAHSLIERIRATLVFDSRQGGLARVGVRSSSALDAPWQLLYRGGDVDVDLMVRANRDGRTISVRGQALSLVGQSIGDGVVEALPINIPRPPDQAPRPSARSELEPTGEFALPNLARGRYDVLLRFGTRQIELSGVEL